ncbi:MAG: thioredoxin family protein [Candidatus Caldatribacterium sp.]|nr:thioredoxin family protein [Candidatus Caldatribacterium sp.]MDW8080407.1 thioredoxin family protein [Candidatus Calescibacterium sp.]
MFLGERDRKTLEAYLRGNLVRPVTLRFFTQELECATCRDVRMLLEEVVALSPLLSLVTHNFLLEKDIASTFRIDKIPAFTVEAERDYGIRFFGIPSGYEFSGFVETIVCVSRGETDLSESTKAFLNTLTQDVHIQVFVTPTCPFCSQAVVLSHKMALESERVTSSMVEILEFPHLAYRYGVRAVPKIVINETVAIEGAVPEAFLVQKILEALV